MVECWWRTLREAADTAIIHVDLTPHAARTACALASLDKAEQARWRRYRHGRPRREFCLCRAALRAVLCRQLGCGNDQLAFETSPYGKPFALVRGTRVPISFNVSHSGSHGLIALAGHGRIGVDVEERRPCHDPDGAIRTAFAPAEQAELAAARGARKAELFFRLWTLKEALLKALGVGLSLDTSGFEVPPALRQGAPTSLFRFPHDPTVGWRLDNLSNADFAAAVAHELKPEAE
jgi:4'-phosphopantetheinyl transferase